MSDLPVIEGFPYSSEIIEGSNFRIVKTVQDGNATLPDVISIADQIRDFANETKAQNKVPFAIYIPTKDANTTLTAKEVVTNLSLVGAFKSLKPGTFLPVGGESNALINFFVNVVSYATGVKIARYPTESEALNYILEVTGGSMPDTEES